METRNFPLSGKREYISSLISYISLNVPQYKNIFATVKRLFLRRFPKGGFPLSRKFYIGYVRK